MKEGDVVIVVCFPYLWESGIIIDINKMPNDFTEYTVDIVYDDGSIVANIFYFDEIVPVTVH